MRLFGDKEEDFVHELKEFPQCCTGAPLPAVMWRRSTVKLAYIARHTPIDWEGKPRTTAFSKDDLPIAMVTFSSCYAQMIGLPNDETLHGHPLAKKGLVCYGAFEIRKSSWVRRLERVNSVHAHHDPSRFERHRHIVLTFHDEMFECVCRDFEVHVVRGSMESAFIEMARMFA